MNLSNFFSFLNGRMISKTWKFSWTGYDKEKDEKKKREQREKEEHGCTQYEGEED